MDEVDKMARSRPARPALQQPVPLDRESAIPLYHQLALRFEAEISALALRSEDRFHTDRALVARFGVSLLTARQAVDQLVAKGLLVRRHGSGTYVTDMGGRQAAASASSAILFCGWNPTSLSAWDAMYFRDVFQGVRDEAQRQGLKLIFDDVELRSAEQLSARIADQRLRGAIALVGDGTHERAELLTRAGLQVVTVNDEVPGLPVVRPDDAAGAEAAVAHLVGLGHRRLAHLSSGEESPHWRDVRLGYLKGLALAGLDPELNPVITSTVKAGNVAAGAETMAEALRRGLGVTAVFAGNDFMAIGALQRLHLAGMMVPRSISVIGFDGIEAGELVVPQLTTMHVDRHQLGAQAVTALLGLQPPARLNATLRVRGTTAPPSI